MSRASKGDVVVRGRGAGGGVRWGRARVVLRPDNLEIVEQGDVLVTRFTSPEFHPVFSRIAGLVTDIGGVLSHAAVVARELGIPAVVGTGDATERIVDGDILLVNGDAGEVTVRRA